MLNVDDKEKGPVMGKDVKGPGGTLAFVTSLCYTPAR